MTRALSRAAANPLHASIEYVAGIKRIGKRFNGANARSFRRKGTIPIPRTRHDMSRARGSKCFTELSAFFLEFLNSGRSGHFTQGLGLRKAITCRGFSWNCYPCIRGQRNDGFIAYFIRKRLKLRRNGKTRKDLHGKQIGSYYNPY